MNVRRFRDLVLVSVRVTYVQDRSVVVPPQTPKTVAERVQTTVLPLQAETYTPDGAPELSPPVTHIHAGSE